MSRLKYLRALSLAALPLLGISCISSPYQGLLFTGTSHHLVSPGRGNEIGSAQILKEGKSCAWSGLFLVELAYGTGNSIREAMEDGKITKVAIVDRTSLSILPGVVYRECILVFGE